MADQGQVELVWLRWWPRSREYWRARLEEELLHVSQGPVNRHEWANLHFDEIAEVDWLAPGQVLHTLDGVLYVPRGWRDWDWPLGSPDLLAHHVELWNFAWEKWMNIGWPAERVHD